MLEGIFNPLVFQLALRNSTPLIFAAMGGVISESSGVVNIALEGLMLIGAFFAVVATYFTGNPYIGVLAAMGSGALGALLHAIASIRYRANQIVSGAALILLAWGLTGFLLVRIFGNPGASPSVNRLPVWKIPLISEIPYLGPILGVHPPLVYASFALVFALHYLLFKTRWGLRVRAVGENPEAADTLGINVFRIRYVCVILSGVFAGAGGAFLSIAQLGMFHELMSNGRGFIALAAMIFGKWRPVGAMLACLLFGFADAFQQNLQSIAMVIPSQFYLMLPFILTMAVLAGFVGKSTPPAADGIPYEKE